MLSNNTGVGLNRCSICEEKFIVQSYFSEELNFQKNYYKECFEYSKQKIPCPDCGEEIAREDMAKHKSDKHTD